MANFIYIGQDVGGDPFVDGQNINIVNASFSELKFYDVDNLFGIPVAGEYVTIDGGTTQYSYQFLGFGNVRGDPLQRAGFVRINLGGGQFRTVAIDMNADGDNLNDLQNGNTGIRVSNLSTTPSQPFPQQNCFCAGTLILTAKGEVPVEQLRAGDMIWTKDHGYLPLLRRLQGRVPGMDRFAPIRIEAGVFGNRRPLFLSPQHRVLISDWRAELYFGASEILVPAVKLLNGRTIRRAPLPVVDYYHVLLPVHSLIQSEGALTESCLSPHFGADVGHEEFAELCEVFPDLQGAEMRRVVRPEVTGAAAIVLAQALV